MQFSHELKLAHMNIRIEKRGKDDGERAIDLKLQGSVQADDLRGLFPTQSDFDVLFGNRWDEKGQPTTAANSALPLDLIGVGQVLRFEPAFADPMEFESVTVDNIHLKLLAGRVVDISMRAQSNPTDDQVGTLSSWLKRGMQLSINGPAATKAEEVQAGLPMYDPGTGDTLDVQEGAENMLPVPDLKAGVADDKPKVEVPGQKPPQRPRKSKSSSAAATH